MPHRVFKRAAGLLGTALILGGVSVAAPASAEWRRAESQRFIVYSESSEAVLRRYVQDLETFDRLLRSYTGLDMEQAPIRKLPLYVVRNHRQMEVVWPNLPETVSGYYTPGEEDIFAMAMTVGGGHIVMHEYGHHFMMQNFAAAYPGWYSEGFAEYFATADIKPGRVDVGKFSQNRAYWLVNGAWMPLSQLLTQRPYEGGRARQETYYPLAWLLTHWFLSDPERRRLLPDYVRAVAAGEDGAEAMWRITGQNEEELTRTLRQYMARRLTYTTVTYPFPEAEVAVTRLGRSADDLLLLNQRLKRTVDEADAPALLAQIRTAAAKHPDDAFARLVLGHAEIDLGDMAQREAILSALLEAEPTNIEALQLMAASRMKQADNETEDLARSDQLQRQARGFLARAYRLDDANYRTFLMIAESRRNAEDYPNDNDLETLRLAMTAAPQLPGARMNLAAALIYSGRPEEGVALLEPVANNPHDVGIAEAAQRLIEQASRPDARQTVIDAAQAAEDTPQDTPEPTDPEMSEPPPA